MTRMEAEAKAETMSRNDRSNNYVAKLNADGTWRVDAFPIHRHDRPIRGRD